MDFSTKSQKNQNLLIFPSGGLNDIFNQVGLALKLCAKRRFTPVVSLELSGEYENQINELLDCRGTGILNHNSAVSMGIMPQTTWLLELRKNAKSNEAVQINDQTYAYFGTGGGIRQSVGLIVRHGLAESVLDQAAKASKNTDLRTTCIHLRCMDLSPDTQVFDEVKEIACSATVYSDGDYTVHLEGNNYVEGYGTSKNHARSSGDLASMLLMSMHDSIILIPIKLDEKTSKFNFQVLDF